MSALENAFIEPAIMLTDDDIAQVSDFPSAIDALRSAYATAQRPGSTPERAVATTSSGWLRVMPSAPTGHRFAGFKVISAAIANGQVSYLIALFDQETSSLAALLDGNRITGMRTAATAAVAVDAMVPQGPQTVAVIGSGFEAREQLTAISSVCDLAGVRVFSPTPAKREAFAREMGHELSVSVTATESAAEATTGAGLIICAARSYDETPTLMREWVDPGTRIVSVGSTTKTQRELDTKLIADAEVIVADALDEVLNDSGDMLVAKNEGIDAAAKTVSLSDLVSGHDRPSDMSGILIYKSTGSGFQDVVLAERIYQRALERGLGTVLPANIHTIRK